MASFLLLFSLGTGCHQHERETELPACFLTPLGNWTQSEHREASLGCGLWFRDLAVTKPSKDTSAMLLALPQRSSCSCVLGCNR